MFLGFSKQKSAASACLFGRLLCEHLRNSGPDLGNTKFQTDNGSEFIGCFRKDRTRDGFERIIEGFGAKQKLIPPRARNYNSDVETVHGTIEDKFYDLENFENIKEFHQRVAGYQARYRKNNGRDANRRQLPRSRLGLRGGN